MAIEVKILAKCSAGTHVRVLVYDTVTRESYERTEYLPELRAKKTPTVEDSVILASIDKATMDKKDVCTIDIGKSIATAVEIKL